MKLRRLWPVPSRELLAVFILWIRLQIFMALSVMLCILNDPVNQLRGADRILRSRVLPLGDHIPDQERLQKIVSPWRSRRGDFGCRQSQFFVIQRQNDHWRLGGELAIDALCKQDRLVWQVTQIENGFGEFHFWLTSNVRPPREGRANEKRQQSF